MTASLQTTRYRLAQHYLNKLRAADAAFRRGQANISYGLTLFDQEWEQIRHWQTWAANQKADDRSRTQLCKDFPLAGLEVLSNRISAVDYARWLESGLEAARQLRDARSERALLHELSITYFHLGILEQAEYYANQLLKLAQAAHDRIGVGRGVGELGSIAEERGLYDEAERHYLQALAIFTKYGMDIDAGRAFHGLGAIALYNGNDQNAYDYFIRSLHLMESGGNTAVVCNALLAVGESLMALEDYGEAKTYIQRAIDLARTFGFQRILAAALISMATWAVEQAQLELSCGYFEEGIRAARAAGSQRNVIHGLSSLGYTQMRLGNFSAAVAHLEQGLQLAREGGMPRYICNLLRSLANTYLALHDLDAARRALLELLSLAQSLDSHLQKSRTLSSVVAYFQALGRSEQAAVWVGVIWDEPALDQPLFAPVCHEIEAALGNDAYQEALENGKQLELDEVVTDVIGLLARSEVESQRDPDDSPPNGTISPRSSLSQ